MATSARKKLERQRAHAAAKKQREHEALFSSKPKSKKEPLKSNAPDYSKNYRETKYYPSNSSTPSTAATAKREPTFYTGELLVGIGTLHKSNAVPIMKGTDEAKDIARMRRG